MNSDIPSKIFKYIIIFLSGLFVIQGILIGIEYFWASDDLEAEFNPPVYRTIESAKGIEHIWTQENIYSFNETKGGKLLDSMDEGVYFLSRFEDTTYKLSLIKFDLFSGKVIWRNIDNRPLLFGDQSPVELTTSPNNIFVTFPGTQSISGETLYGAAKLESYDIDGNSVWLRSIGGARSIITMVASDTTISINGDFSSNYYLLDATSGRILNTTPKNSGNFIWYIENGVKYEQKEFLIQAVELSNETILWQNTVNEPIYMAPVFSNQQIVLRTNKAQLLGTAIALDKGTGEIIWEYPNVLTNIAIDGFVAFFLTKDMRLVGIDIKTGDTLVNTPFEPNKAVDSVNNVYQLTASNGIIVIYFGGTNQLSAYRSFVGD